MSEIKVFVAEGAMGYAAEVLSRIFAPRTAKQRENDITRYSRMTYRFYNQLVKRHTECEEPLRISSRWDVFIELNPDIEHLVRLFNQHHQYELSYRQVSAALAALVEYPKGPPIEVPSDDTDLSD